MRVCYRVDVIAEPNVGDLKAVFDVWFSFSEWRNIRGMIFLGQTVLICRLSLQMGPDGRESRGASLLQTIEL